jgi:hypothetical protein
MTDTRRTIMINRATVITLWTAVVAERLGFDREEALTLGRAVAGLNAYSKGVALGLFEPTPQPVKEQRKKARPSGSFQVALLGRAMPAVQMPEGVTDRHLALLLVARSPKIAFLGQSPANPATFSAGLLRYGYSFTAANPTLISVRIRNWRAIWEDRRAQSDTECILACTPSTGGHGLQRDDRDSAKAAA